MENKLTTEYAIEFLTPERVEELWVHLDPMLQKSCEGNEISKEDLTPKEIHDLATSGQCAMFVYFENAIPTCVLVVQFFVENKKKGASILAMGGKNLLTFKRLYWKSILDWLKVNKIHYLDACVATEYTKIYLKKFGFEKSCSLVRMNLKEIENG
jgi:hypothetical protein